MITKTVPTFYFVGVTTGSSSIMKLFPLWMAELGLPNVVIEGFDCKIHDDPARYRLIVQQIKQDPLSLGALVTTHKIDLLRAAQDLFDTLDPYATILEEVSSISKAAGKLVGHAKDPISAGMTLQSLLGRGYFGRTGGEVLCFGAGGSGMAISLYLLTRPDAADRPARMVITDRDAERLANLQKIVAAQKTDMVFDFQHTTQAAQHDALLAQLPESSIVINATGMGKDTVGSPLTPHAVFPQRGIIWELNYRGELDFWHQAVAQQTARSLQVEDGWVYFLHGWTQVMTEVLHIPIEGEIFQRLATIASHQRGA